jgi:hypothetical protein
MRTHIIASLIVFTGCYGSYQPPAGMTDTADSVPVGTTDGTPPLVDNDQDNDGHDSVTSGGDDCNDTDAGINPEQADNTCDGIDQDCDGIDGNSGSDTFRSAASECGGVDEDGDGAMDEDGDGNVVDCNDTDASVFPGAPEVPYDGVDQDCDGSDLRDADGDGHEAETVGGDDCDDGNPDINPDTTEVLDNGIDEDCDPANDTSGDADADGFTVGDGDCNDADAGINPDATDIPNNGVDEDCSGWDLGDVDCDGWSAENEAGDVVDCDDANPDVHPEALEVMGNGTDDDCDPLTLDAAADPDTDWDGTVDSLDCDDTDPDVHPGATEVADDGIDQDCDGVDMVTVAHPENCAGGYSRVYGTFTGPVGSTITAISGERIPHVGNDDMILWSTWTDGSPVNMTVDFVGNVGTFVLDSCVDDAADWNASVTYTDANNVVHYDCEASVFTGTWTVEFDNDIQVVTPEVWDPINGSCNALW